MDIITKMEGGGGQVERRDEFFFSAVAELAESRGFEVAGVKGGALNLNLNGEFAAAVDETGAMNYHPYKEVFDMMDEVLKIRAEIPYDNPEEGMQLNM